MRRLLQFSSQKQLNLRRDMSLVKMYEQCYRTVVHVYQFNNEVKVGKTDVSLLEDVVSNSGRIQFELMSFILKAGQFFSIGPVDDLPFNLMQVVWVISPHAKWARSSKKLPL